MSLLWDRIYSRENGFEPTRLIRLSLTLRNIIRQDLNSRQFNQINLLILNNNSIVLRSYDKAFNFMNMKVSC